MDTPIVYSPVSSQLGLASRYSFRVYCPWAISAGVPQQASLRWLRRPSGPWPVRLLLNVDQSKSPGNFENVIHPYGFVTCKPIDAKDNQYCMSEISCLHHWTARCVRDNDSIYALIDIYGFGYLQLSHKRQLDIHNRALGTLSMKDRSSNSCTLGKFFRECSFTAGS